MNSRNWTKYLKHFSSANWKASSESQKTEYTVSNCDACQVHHFAIQSLFPNTAKLRPQKLIKDALTEEKLEKRDTAW